MGSSSQPKAHVYGVTALSYFLRRLKTKLSGEDRTKGGRGEKRTAYKESEQITLAGGKRSGRPRKKVNSVFLPRRAMARRRCEGGSAGVSALSVAGAAAKAKLFLFSQRVP